MIRDTLPVGGAIGAAKSPDYLYDGDKYDVLIPWSGGFDSTALILKALAENKKVAWSAYHLENNFDQANAEANARLKIINYIRHRGLSLHGQVTHHFNQIHYPSEGRYSVPKFIVTSTVSGASAKEIWLGYTRTDCVCDDWKFEDHAAMIPVIQGLWGITRTSPCPVVRVPFLDTDKVEMLKYYKDFRPVLDWIATCETGNNDVRFCNCAKCKKLDDLRTIFNKTLA
jgi:7-cyano-7-deazaguanine synthase in queuosine biosynthesis